MTVRAGRSRRFCASRLPRRAFELTGLIQSVGLDRTHRWLLAVPAAWSSAPLHTPLHSARARLLRLLRARLAALSGSAFPEGRGRATGRPASVSATRASRL